MSLSCSIVLGKRRGSSASFDLSELKSGQVSVDTMRTYWIDGLDWLTLEDVVVYVRHWRHGGRVSAVVIS